MGLMGYMQLESIARKRYIYVEAIKMACYILNWVYQRRGTLITPYEIWKDKKQNLKHFHNFCSPSYTLNVRKTKGRFVPKSNGDKIIDLRYLSTKTQLTDIFIKGLDAALET